MPTEKVDVAIAGGGMAGLAAAEVLSRHGAGVMILEDNPRPGGQFLRGGRGYGGGRLDQTRRRGLQMVDRLARSPVTVCSATEILGIDSGLELLAASAAGEIFTVKAGHLLLATGARERFMPFPGWTLPGVLATGAVQILIKQSGVLPARNTLVAGAGLFPTAVACDIQNNGGRVEALFDEMPWPNRIPPPAIIGGHAGKFMQGGAMVARLLLSGTAVRHRTRIVTARGDDRLREVVAARLNRRGEIIPGSEVVHPVASLAVGFGFTANIELAQLAGCGLAYNRSLGGWIVQVNEELETDVDGISAAGEITGIGGAVKSVIEGRLAALSILRRLGRLAGEDRRAEVARLKETRRRLIGFARYFNTQYMLPRERLATILQSLPDEVCICRCEGVSIGALRRAIAAGFDTPAGVKKATRCGMGFCQGSTCKSILLDLLATSTGKPRGIIPPPSVRMPVKPVYLGTLGAEAC